MAKVLVVEDEALIALDIAQCLRSQGHQICGTCSSASEAVAIAAAADPQIILMDISLNGRSSGISAASKIRERSNVPIIFLSAHADDSSMREASQVGSKSYLVKPFKDHELIAAVRGALGGVAPQY